MTTDWQAWRSTVAGGPLAGRHYDIRSIDTGGPPVVVLHELFGPSEETRELGNWLAAHDPPFSVHVPALFGRHWSTSMTGLLRSKVCLRREFVLLRTGQTSPIVTWLRQLVDEVADRHDGRPVGVVGMCLTGGFAMALVAEPSVAAAVASQPSLPLAPLRSRDVQADLGLSPDDVPPADGADLADLTVLRYEDDWMCPRARVEAMAGEPLSAPVADDVDPRVSVSQGSRGRLVHVEGRRHALLTFDLNDRARTLVGGWLADALGQ
jgi:dienelactone hydrolase